MSNFFDKFDNQTETARAPESPEASYSPKVGAQAGNFFDQFDESQETPAEPESRGFGEMVSDAGASIMSGFSGLANAGLEASRSAMQAQQAPVRYMAKASDALGITDGFEQRVIDSTNKPFDSAGKVVDRASEHWDESRSDSLRAQRKNIADAEGVVGTAKAVVDNLGAGVDYLIESLPYSLVPGAAARGAATKAASSVLSKGGSQQAAKEAATKAGALQSAVFGGLLEGGSAAGEARRAVLNKTPAELIPNSAMYNELREEGFTHEQAIGRVADRAGLTAMAVTTPISMLATKVTGAGEVDADFFTGEGVKDALSALFKQTAEEAVQEGSSQLGSNVGQRWSDNRQEYFEGVPEAATLGGLLGVSQAGAMKGIDTAIKTFKPTTAEDIEAELDDDTDVENELRELEAGLGDGDSGHQRPWWEQEQGTELPVDPSAQPVQSGRSEIEGYNHMANAAPGEAVFWQSPDGQREAVFARVAGSMGGQDIAEVEIDGRRELVPMGDLARVPNYTPEPEQTAQPETTEAPEGTVNFERPGIPERPGLELEPQQAEYSNGVDFSSQDLPQNTAKRDQMAAGVQRLIDQHIDQSRYEKLPEGLKDPRLLREEHRTRLEQMAGELVKGGDVGYVRDEHDRITGRTPSVNPEWFKAVTDDSGKKLVTTEQLKTAVDKALRGEKLGERQAAAVQIMLDEIQHDRQGLIEQRLQERADAIQSRDAKRIAESLIDPDLALPESGPAAAAVSEVVADILSRGYSRDKLQSLIQQYSADGKNPLPQLMGKLRAEGVFSEQSDGREVRRGSDNARGGSPDRATQAEARAQPGDAAPDIPGFDGEPTAEQRAESERELSRLFGEPKPSQEPEPANDAGSSVSGPQGNPADQENFLESYTEQDIADREAQAESLPEQEQRAQVDREREEFGLDGGSATVAGSNDPLQKPQGGDMFAPSRGESSPESFVPAPDGSADFGEVSESVAKAVGRQAGKIRLQEGVHKTKHQGYGRAHIAAEHPEIKDIAGFVRGVASEFDAIYKGRRGRLQMVKGGSPDELLVVELRPMEGGDFYSVVSAYKSRKVTGEKLWDAAQSRPSGPGGQNALSESGSLDSSGESRPSAKQSATGKSIGQKSNTGQSGLPKILTDSRKKTLIKMAKERGIKRGSPGYDAAMARLGEEYEQAVDRAQAELTFEQFNALNSDSPESVNRQAYDALREEYGIDETVPAGIDAAANQADTNPTEAQKEAGNYQKGHINVQGLDISIENPKGSERSGTDPDGNDWSVTMNSHYGYIKSTSGADGEHVDVFVGPEPESQRVYVVDQVSPDGSFDEHKVLVGYRGKLAATKAYKDNYTKGWKVGPVTSMSMDEFKAWLKDGDNTKPLNADHFSDAKKKPSNEVEKQETPAPAEPKTRWVKSGKKQWKSEGGRIIQDESYTLKGKRVTRYRVYGSESDLAKSVKYAEGNTLVETKENAAKYLPRLEEYRAERAGDGDVALFKSGRAGYSSIGKREAQPTVDRIASSLPDSTAKIELVDSFDEFPEVIKKSAKTLGFDGARVKGAYRDGTVYLNRSALKSAEDVERTIFHELYGHHGLKTIFGQDVRQAMGRLYLRVGGLKGVRELARNHNIDLSRYERGLSKAVNLGIFDRGTANSILAEELLAHISENQKPSVIRALKEFIGAIRSWLRKNGFIALSKITDSDIMQLLKQSRQAGGHSGISGPTGTIFDLAGEYEGAQAAPAFSVSSMPRPTRKIIGDDPVLAGWTMLAQNDDAFQLPISDKKGIEEIFAEIEGPGGVQIVEAEELALQNDYGAEKSWRIITPQGKRAAIYQKGDSVWIDVSAVEKGQNGKRIYNAVANYAHNNDLVFVGDPDGLSDVAQTRRLENMISSALKFGTTKHLWPHQNQVTGNSNVDMPNIEWKDGDDAHNLRQMIDASYQSVVNQFPEIQNLRYNPKTDQFEDSKTGEVWDGKRFDAEARALRGLQNAGGSRSPLTAGRTTLERAVLTGTLSRGTRQEVTDILEKYGQRGSKRLTGQDNAVLYSVDSEPRPSAGVSRSGDVLFSIEDNPDSLTTDREKEALDKLGLKPEARKGILKRIASITTQDIRNAIEEGKKRTYEGIFDGLVGIKRAEESAAVGIGAGDHENSGFVGAVLATGTADVMHHLLEYGAVKWEGGVLQPAEGTRGLLEILGDLGPNMRDWLAWMAANRAAELMKQGRENNLTKDDIQVLFRRASGKLESFKKAKKEYNKLNNAMLNMAEQAGLIDPESRKEWESEWYIPFYRRNESDGNLSIMSPRTSQGLSHQSSGIKALRGGELGTNNLLDNILTNWLKLADSSMKNGALLKTVDNLKDTEFLQDESIRYQQAIIPRSEIARQIKKDKDMRKAVAEFMGMTESVSVVDLAEEIMKPENKGFEKLWAAVAPRDPDIIRVQRNGKSEYYRVADPALLRAVKHLGHEGFNSWFMRGFRFFKRILTTGVTTSPDFIIRNFIRDALHSWTINPDGMKLGRDSVRGLAGAFKQDQNYRALVASGAAFQGGYVHGTDPEASAQVVRRALYSNSMKHIDPDSVLSTPEKIWSVLQKGWQSYRGWGDKVENTNRLATFKKALESGKPIAQAVYESKDLMDYSRRGNFAAMMILSDVIPFLNARVQGFGKLARAAGENPKIVAMRASMIASFSIGLALLNADDERYEELPDWEKDMYWHFFIGKDHWRVPKPFEIGIVAGTLPERVALNLVGAQENEKLAWTLKHNLMGTFGFSGPYGLPFPQALQPLVEVAANKSFYFDMPIEGMADEGKLPEARYDAHTSDTMRKLGEWAGLSPKKLEHLLRGYTGTMGAYILGATDVATRMATDHPGKPEKKISDYPAAKALYRGDSPRTNRYVAQLYQDMKKAEEVYRTIRAYTGEGRDSLADKLITKHEDKLASLGMYRTVRRQMSQIRKAMLDVQNNRALSAGEKRKQLDELIKTRNQLAKKAVKAVAQSREKPK